MKTVLYRLTSFLAALLFAGCVSTGNNFDESKLSEIRKGQTTEQDLMHMFGQPQNRIINSEGVLTLTWTYAESRVKGESFIPFAGAFAGGGKTRAKSLSVRLQNDKVTEFTFSGGGSETRNVTQAPPKN